MFIDATLEDKGQSAMFTEEHFSRKGTWYIAITILDEQFEDALSPKYRHREVVENYVKAIKNEYLGTQEYIEIYLRAQ